MTVPRLRILPLSTAPSDDRLVLLAALATDDGPALLASSEYSPVSEALSVVGFAAGKDELIRLPHAGTSVAVIGLGRERSIDGLRYSVGSAARQLAGVAGITIAIPFEDDAEIEGALEGAALGAYGFSAFRSASLAAVKTPVSDVVALADTERADEIVSRVTATSEAVALVKDLVNTPPSDLYPETLAQAALDAASGLPIDVRVWDEDELEQDGFGGIGGVGMGSARPPRLVKLSYTPANAEGHLALVGKGITFDSGGLSLKPPAGMVGMKYDMTGAATVLAVIVAAAKLQLPIRLTAWMCIAENMPSGSALRPNDVLRIRGGRTVEVLNTDAEGRLVLADGIVAASEEQPDAIVDVATLTGAAMVALGTRYGGVMGDDELVGSVLSAAKASGELLWQMPLPGELRAQLNSDVADIANASPGNTAGGMLLAAVFLQEFVGKQGDGEKASRIPWAHLDIAGPAKSPSAPFGFTGKGPTGVTVRALIRLAEDFSQNIQSTQRADKAIERG